MEEYKDLFFLVFFNWCSVEGDVFTLEVRHVELDRRARSSTPANATSPRYCSSMSKHLVQGGKKRIFHILAFDLRLFFFFLQLVFCP